MKIKHILSIVLVFVLCFGVCSFALADENTEVPEGYTPIYTAEDLYNIRNDLDGKFILMNDIDLSVYDNWEPIGSSETPFTGELDGNEYVIKNLKINSICKNEKKLAGLFGIAEDSFFKKVIIKNGKISVVSDESTDFPTQTIAAGMLVAKTTENGSACLSRCAVSGEINITGFDTVQVGGLVGAGIEANYIYNSSNYADINIVTSQRTKSVSVGGVIGGVSENNTFSDDSNFYFEESVNFGNITVNNENCADNARFLIGGMVGYLIGGNDLLNSYNRGDIQISNSNGQIFVGGITGRVCSRVERCYSSGVIKAEADENDVICNIGFVENIGGLAIVKPQFSFDYIVYRCYSLIGELDACIESPDDYSIWYKVEALTEEEFKNQESFVGFDFENIWVMEENGYPVLRDQTVLPEDTPEEPTTESTTESTTEPSTEPDTEVSTESTVENSTEDITEPSTEPSDNECPLANLWIVKAIKWLLDSIWSIIENISNLF